MTPNAASSADFGVVVPARTALGGLRTTLGSGGPSALVGDLDEQLHLIGEHLRVSLLDAAQADVGSVVDRLALIFAVGEMREDVRSRDLVQRLHVLACIEESLLALHECKTPEELIEAAPAQLCRSCGFSRALISRVHGSHWVPQVMTTAPRSGRAAARIAENIAELEIQLDQMLPETELVRRRMAALITDPVGNPLELISATSSRASTPPYVAAPIMPTGRVIGFLHADRIGQPHPVTVPDRDNLWRFAEQFGFLYERAVLLERLDAQREQLHAAFVDTETVVDELWQREIELTRGSHDALEVTHAAAGLFRPTQSRLDGLITRREREVLELMTGGATNHRIAEQLVISEGTVKSHVKHLLRKLRAANRAEAVARYLQILMREQHDGYHP